MQILQVIPYFVPAWDRGGPLNAAYNLSKELVKRGHQVTVYTTDILNKDSKIKNKEVIIDGIKIKRFTNLSNFIAYNQNIYLTPGIICYIDKTLKDFDIIHIHEYRTLQNVIVYHYANKYGIPYILQPHGSLPRIITKQGLKSIYDELWGYKLLRNASKIIALTQPEAEQCKNLGITSNKIEIIPNGIDLNEFNDLPIKGEFKKKHSINNKDKIILFLGRINAIKGVGMLVKAHAKLLKQIKDVKLVIVGPDDGYLSKLKQLITDLKIGGNVIITGPLYGRNKLEAYVDAELYVLPSIYEIFAITVLEAMACGTPVIVTDRCGIANIIGEQAGIVVPCNEDALGEAILNILGDVEKRQEYGYKGKLLARENFNWDKISKQIEVVYMTCITSKRS